MRKIVLTFGLIAGAVMSVMMFITLRFQDQIGFDRAAVVGYTTMVLAFLMVFVGVKTYRDTLAGGSVTFGRAFLVGLLIMLVGTVCYVATWEVIYHKVMPDFGDKYAAYAVDNAKKAGKTDAQVAELTRQMAEFKEAYKNPLVNVAYTFLEPLPVGLPFALIAAFVYSRKRRGPGTALAT